MQTLIFVALPIGYFILMLGAAMWTGKRIRKQNQGHLKTKIISMNSVVISKARSK
jgi:hypothetical protein